MSEKEIIIETESVSKPEDIVQTDEAEKPSESILQNATTAITDSSEQNSNPSPQVIDSLSSNLEIENSTLISCSRNSRNADSPIKSTESISSENTFEVTAAKPEEEVNSSDPSKSVTSSDQASSSNQKDESVTLTEGCHTNILVPSEKLQSVSRDFKPTTKIKVIINSIETKSLEPEKVLEKNPSASNEVDENSKPDNVPKECQQEIKSSPNETEKIQSSQQYAEHVTYSEDGIAIYVDPKTQHKYKWSPEKNDWIAFDQEDINPTACTDNENSKKSNPYENEHYRWCTETNQWIPKNNEQFSSLTETEHYRWDAQKNEWIMKNQVPSLDDVTYGYEDGVRIYTDKDGMVFFWDADKKAWFPKIDDDFLAKYQMSYGFIDNTAAPAPESTAIAAEEDEKNIELEKQIEEIKKKDAAAAVAAAGGVKRKAPPEPPKWFEIDPTQNTKVYVSNLPLDITMEEFSEIMSKCGMIMKDPQTQKQKLKLYTEADGQLKGDGLCDYIKVESVDLALNLLDESIIRGSKIKVQRAKFQMRGEYNPSLKPKRKKKDKEKLLKMKEKLFDWRPEKMRGERSKHERTVIIKNLFTPELFDKEVQLIIDYQNDLREECSKCGTVRKVVIYDRHAEGVAQVNMADPDQADLVIQMMNGRFFGQRKLTAETWDGKAKYKVAETEEEIQARINKWDKYLEKGELKEQDEEDEDDQNSNKTTKNKRDGNEKVEPVLTA